MPSLALVLTTAPLNLQAPLVKPKVYASAGETQPLQVGSKVPNVAIRDLASKPIQLSAELKGKKTVLVFYRGGWCPFCNRQMSDLQAREGELKALGYEIVAVSPDRPEELAGSIGKLKLTYTLLSDSKATAIRAFGLGFKVDDATVKTYKEKYNIDLERSSGETHHILPVPAVFLVGPDLTIRYAFSNPDYKVRLSGDDLVAAAKANP